MSCEFLIRWIELLHGSTSTQTSVVRLSGKVWASGNSSCDGCFARLDPLARDRLHRGNHASCLNSCLNRMQAGAHQHRIAPACSCSWSSVCVDVVRVAVRRPGARWCFTSLPPDPPPHRADGPSPRKIYRPCLSSGERIFNFLSMAMKPESCWLLNPEETVAVMRRAWLVRAQEIFRREMVRGDVLTGEAMRMVLKAKGLRDPRAPGAWGMLVLTLARRKLIEETRGWAAESSGKRVMLWRVL